MATNICDHLVHTFVALGIQLSKERHHNMLNEIPVKQHFMKSIIPLRGTQRSEQRLLLAKEEHMHRKRDVAKVT